MIHAIVTLVIGVVVITIAKEIICGILSHIPKLKWLYIHIEYGNLFIFAVGCMLACPTIYCALAAISFLFGFEILWFLGLSVMTLVLLALTVGAFAWNWAIATDEMKHVNEDGNDEDEGDSEDDDGDADGQDVDSGDDDDHFKGMLKSLDDIRKVPNPESGDIYVAMDEEVAYIFNGTDWERAEECDCETDKSRQN